MALAIDSQMGSSTGASANATTLTFSFTNTAGTFIVVGISFGNASAFTVSTITYNGVSMTQVPGAVVGYDGATHNFAGASLFSLLSPATGANNVVVTMSGVGGGTTSIEGGAISFTGHDLVTPIVASSGKSNFRESNGPTATVTSGSTTVGNIVVAQMATGSGYSSVSTGTLSWSKNASSLSAGGNGAMTQASGTGGTITMTDNITSDFMGMVCFEVAAASGGGARGLFRTPAMNGLGGGGSFFRDPLAAPMQMVRRDRIFVPAWLGEAA
jgi:hypothetical protein